MPDSNIDLTSEVLDASRHFFVALYDRREFAGNLDVLRAHLFASRKGDLRSLPPTENAFRQHVLRSLHQLVVSKRAHISQPVYPDATIFGIQLVDGKLIPTMLTKEALPQAVKLAKYCKCKTGRCLKGCICARAKVKCAIACLCTGDPQKCGRIEIAMADRDSD
jgi:hypothetical protein